MPGAGDTWSAAFDYALRLWQRETTATAPPSVDADGFERVLARHRLALALPAADQLKERMAEPLRAILHARQRRMTLRVLAQTAALREIVATLRAAGVGHCVLKGLGYAALFGTPQRREACDIDLLVAPPQRDRALCLLQDLGYALDPAAAADLERYCIDNHALPLRHPATGVALELHLRLANQARQFRLAGPLLWDRHTTSVTLAGVEVTTLAPAAAVVYAAFHGTKHNWHRAFWLVDLAQAMRCATLDWDATLALAHDLEVERHLAMGALLVEATLGVALPPALRMRTALLRSARPAADALLPHLDALGSDRGADLAARLGMVRYTLRLFSLQSTWRGRLQLIPFLLAPTQDDRSALALPGYLHWAYPGLRAIRLVKQHLAKRRQTGRG